MGFFKRKSDVFSSLIEGAEGVSYTSFYHDAFKRLRRDKVAMVCLAVVVLIVLAAIFAPLITPYEEDYMDIGNELAGPSAKHWLGTDEFGRDVFTRIIYGSRVSLMVGLVAESIAVAIGLIVGAVAGFYGGKVDAVLSRIIEIFASFPHILFAIVVMFVLGTGIINVFIAVGVVGWTGLARVIRSQIMQLKQKEYVEAARASGGRNMQIIFRHLIPNCLSTIIVVATMNIPSDIMYEASLSFLGLGVQPPQASWGSMISEARKFIRQNPGYSVFPGVALIITVLAFNLLGDALRDALDPRLKNL